MLVLRTSPASPFGRKVKIAAHELGLMERIEIVPADTTDPKDVLRPRTRSARSRPWCSRTARRCSIRASSSTISTISPAAGA